MKMKALVIDDVNVVRIPIRSALTRAGFEVIEASSAEEGGKKVGAEKVDFITLDLHLPGMDGSTWLKELRAKKNGTPVVIVTGSSEAEASLVYDALNSGAQEFFEKDKLSHEVKKLAEVALALTKKHTALLPFNPPENVSKLAEFLEGEIKFIAIGGGTGGPEALWSLLENVPKPMPPVVIVQHTNAFFAKHFGKTIARVSGLTLGQCADGEMLRMNHVYLSLEDRHLCVESSGAGFVLRLNASSQVHGSRPSIDRLFESVAKLKCPAIGILLSGVGEDGVQGLSKMKNNDVCFNFSQSLASCIAVDMPERAIKAHAVHFTGDPSAIRKKLLELVTPRPIGLIKNA